MSRVSVVRIMFLPSCVIFLNHALWKKKQRIKVRNWKRNHPDKVKEVEGKKKVGEGRERKWVLMEKYAVKDVKVKAKEKTRALESTSW